MYPIVPSHRPCLPAAIMILLSIFSCVFAVNHGPSNMERMVKLQEVLSKWSTDYNYGGIATFAHLRHVNCLVDKSTKYDIAIIGIPLETASWRAGARLAPQSIREASSRQNGFRGFNHRASINPFTSWARIFDCGDVPITSFDQSTAEIQIGEVIQELSLRPAATNKKVYKSKLIAVGGNKASTRSAVLALQDVYQQQIAVVSFGAYLDTTRLDAIININSSIHVGYHGMHKVGENWQMTTRDPQSTLRAIFLDDIDDLGCSGLASEINTHVGTVIPVFLSINLNIIDVGLAPGLSEPCVGGWTTRELIAVLRSIEGLNVVGAEVVGVAPIYDGEGEQTTLSAAQIVYEILTSMVKRGVLEKQKEKT